MFRKAMYSEHYFEGSETLVKPAFRRAKLEGGFRNTPAKRLVGLVSGVGMSFVGVRSSSARLYVLHDRRVVCLLAEILNQRGLADVYSHE
jgi:hypothetical protein